MRALLLLFALFIASAASAQCDLISPLKAEGFENLIQTSLGDRLELHYENRRYRYEGRALYEVLKII